MKYVVANKEIRYFDFTIPKHAVLPVEETGGMWRRIVDGPYKGKCVRWGNVDQFPIYQELLQRREEVKELMKRVGVAEAEEKLAVKNADRLQHDVFQLQKERKNLCRMANQREDELLKELAEAREGKKVPLPREVAEAIGNLRDRDFSDYGIIIESHVISSTTKWPPGTASRLETIRKFTYQNTGEHAVGESGADILLKALVNGCTIEQTLAERLNEGVRQICSDWYGEAINTVDEDMQILSDRISNYVKGFYAESSTTNG